MPLAVIAGYTACSEPPDGRLCPQTFEFSNLGCARVTGTVRDGVGKPLAGVVVALVPPSTSDNFYDYPSATTEAAGTYALEIHRFDGPPVAGAADTIPLYLRGTAADNPDFRDSVLVEVIFVSVDSVAQTVTGELVLAPTQ